MNTLDAGRILDRLKAHYPRLAENEQASKDWLNEICGTPDPEPIARWMIEEWDKDRSPRVSDWVRARRTSVHQAVVAHHREEPLIELESVPTVPPERVHALLSDAAKALAAGRLEEARRPLVDHARGWSPLRYPDGGEGLAVRMLEYHEAYEEPPEEDA